MGRGPVGRYGPQSHPEGFVRMQAQAGAAIAAKVAYLAGKLGPVIGEMQYDESYFFSQALGAAMIYWSPDTAGTGAHVVYGEIRNRYDNLTGPHGYLGLPLLDEMDTYDGARRVSYFQHGYITWNRSGPHGGYATDEGTPGWEYIRGFFSAEDRRHMLYGSPDGTPVSPLDLDDYDTVNSMAAAIFDRVRRPYDDKLRMPPPPDPQWPAELVDSFRAWMICGKPR